MKIILTSFMVLLIWANAALAFDLKIENDHLWLHARQTPLQEILQKIVSQGIKVKTDPLINPYISIDIEGKPLQTALKSLLKSTNHVLVWKSDFSSSAIYLAEIQIFETGGKSRIKYVKASDNFDLARNPKDGSLYVRGEILLRRKKGVADAEFEAFIKKMGGTIVEKDKILGIYKIRLPQNTNVPNTVEKIKKNKYIADAEPNYAYPIVQPYKTFETSRAFLSNKPVLQGSAAVAVLDSGLSPNTDLDQYVSASLDAVNPENVISDNLGHGTQMAFIASGAISPAGVSNDNETSTNPVIAVRAFDDNGVTSNFSLMRSIEFALEKGARVLSLSWGTETSSEFLKDALNYADSNNLIVVAAAGNKATGTPVYPAAYSSVVGVGALAPDGTVWENSNYGSFVSVSAPGFAQLPVGYQGEPGAYAGTSIATAFVASNIAQYLTEHPNASKQEIFKALDIQF